MIASTSIKSEAAAGCKQVGKNMSIHFVRTLLSQSRNLPYQLEFVSFITNIKFAVSLFSNVLPEHCFLCGVLHPTDKYFALASLQKLQMQNVGWLSSFENIVVLCTGTMNGGAGLPGVAWISVPPVLSSFCTSCTCTPVAGTKY